jgi:transketolase
LALTRQNLAVFPKDDGDWRNTIRTGAYIVKRAAAKSPAVVVIASGSEVGLALEAAALSGADVQVVSMISRELFESQPTAIQDSIVPPGVKTVVAEAGVSMGWERWAQSGNILAINRFGESGPAARVAEHLGFTAQALAAIINA